MGAGIWNALIKELSENSTGIVKSLVNSYLSHLRSFCLFLVSDEFTKADTYIRDKKLSAILKNESWIIEGVFYGWLEESFKNADIVIILKTNVIVRDWRIIKRFVKRKLGFIPSKRESIKGLIDLLIWNHKYDNRNLKEAIAMIEQCNKKNVVLDNNLDALRIIGDCIKI